VFATNRTTRLSDNFLAVYEELQTRNSNFEYVFLLKRMPKSLRSQLLYMVHLVRATYHLATCRYFIIEDFYYPVYVTKALRKGTYVIQLWHACGAFKKFGYSLDGKTFRADDDYLKMVKIHSNYSRVYVSGDACIEPYAEAFGMEDEKHRILPLGAARTDRLYDLDLAHSVRRKLEEKYPSWIGKKLVLFCPTFRGNNQQDAHYNLVADFEEFKRKLGDSYVLLLRFHPLINNKPHVSEAHRSFVYDVTDYPNVNDLLSISDYLITDYSSVIFEFALLNRPIVFLINDLEAYIAERDFYFDFEKMVPGPVVSHFGDAITCIQANDFDLKQVDDFAAAFFNYRDGHAARRIVDDILSLNK
jgi:CDP-ribitol ribitolphosphotransferase